MGPWSVDWSLPLTALFGGLTIIAIKTMRIMVMVNVPLMMKMIINNKPNLFETKQDNHMIKEQKQIPSIH